MEKNKKLNQKIEEMEGISLRQPLGFARIFLRTVALISSLYHFYFGYFAIPPGHVHRPIHLIFIFIIMFLLYPFPKRQKNIIGKIPIYDWLLIIFTVLSAGYLVINAEQLSQRMFFLDKITFTQYFYGSLLICLILIASYRVIGKPLLIVTISFLLYAHFGNYLPGFLWHKGYSITRIIEYLYLSLDAIWTIPIHVTSTYVYLFILFGTFLRISGAGAFFMDLSRSLTHKTIGGPAKTAIFASSLMGTVSGSSTANVVTTGSFTIPMMKSVGYSSTFAGAVEAVASTGGQLVPPVMGAAAFMMAEIIGVPYINIMKHAIIPAFLYYLSLYIIVHIESIKVTLKPSPEEPITFKNVMLQKGYMLLPIIAIIYFLMKGYTPMRSAWTALITSFVLEFIRNRDRKGFLKKIIESFIEAPQVLVPVTVACASAGIIVGIINLTGLGLRLSPMIFAVAGDRLIICLFLTMILALILGMGLPTSGAYIIMAVMLAPGLVKLGISPLAAHFFVFYFACLSAITPPVALASYAGAGIAGANSNKTGFLAFRLALTAFIVPYMFVYGPSLLLIGDNYLEITVAIITASLGVFSLAFSVTGWLYGKINYLLRILLFLSALLLIKPGISTDVSGIIILSIIVLYRYISTKNKKI